MSGFSLPPDGRRHQLNTDIYAAIAGRPSITKPTQNTSEPAEKIPSATYIRLSQRLKRTFCEQMPLLKIVAAKRLGEAKSRIGARQTSKTKSDNASPTDWQ